MDWHGDIFGRMGDVELMAELRRVAQAAARRRDHATAARARRLFAACYAARQEPAGPGHVERVLETMRTLVRQFPD